MTTITDNANAGSWLEPVRRAASPAFGTAAVRNLIYAPGPAHRYSAKTLPGIREAIEQRWKGARRYIAITAAAPEAAADRLESVRRLDFAKTLTC